MSDLWSHSHEWDNGYCKGHKDGYEQGRKDAIEAINQEIRSLPIHVYHEYSKCYETVDRECLYYSQVMKILGDQEAKI